MSIRFPRFLFVAFGLLCSWAFKNAVFRKLHRCQKMLSQRAKRRRLVRLMSLPMQCTMAPWTWTLHCQERDRTPPQDFSDMDSDEFKSRTKKGKKASCGDLENHMENEWKLWDAQYGRVIVLNSLKVWAFSKHLSLVTAWPSRGHNSHTWSGSFRWVWRLEGTSGPFSLTHTGPNFRSKIQDPMARSTKYYKMIETETELSKFRKWFSTRAWNGTSSMILTAPDAVEDFQTALWSTLKYWGSGKRKKVRPKDGKG